MPAFLAVVEGITGDTLQILYDQGGGRYVGHPEGWQPPAKRELPELPDGETWTIEKAQRWCNAHPNGGVL